MQQQQEVTVPTMQELTAQITQLVMNRSSAKDAIEGFEKQIPVLQGQLQLLMAQAEVAKQAKAETPAE